MAIVSTLSNALILRIIFNDFYHVKKYGKQIKT